MRVDENVKTGQTTSEAAGAASNKLTGAELARLAQAGSAKESGETKRAEGGAGGEDRIRLSQFASNVGGGESTREGRIEELRALVNAGKYEPDLGSVAERMIEDALMEGRVEGEGGGGE